MADDHEKSAKENHALPNFAEMWQRITSSSTSPPAPPNLPPSALEPSANTDSQPMTTTSSASSAFPPQVRSVMDENGQSPYGTRSRNRTGNSRPNYAEDRELDIEYDWAPASKKARDTSTSTSSTNLQSEENESSGVSTRRRSLTTAVLSSVPKVGNPTIPKDQIPGMSSFSVYPESGDPPQPPSKKRKAPGAVPAAPSNPLTGTASTANHTTSRKTPKAVSAHPSRSSNILTFETSQGCLKNGELTADDGTGLNVNGTYLPAIHFCCSKRPM